MKNQLIRSINTRIGAELSPQNPVSIVGIHQVSSYVDTLISIVYLYTRPKKGKGNTVYLAEMISAIGHTLLSKWRKPVNSALAAKIGAFMLYSFEDIGLLEVILGHGNKGHNAYLVNVLRDDVLMELWNSLPNSTIEKLPSLVPYSPWKTGIHSTGLKLIKTQDKEVLSVLSAETGWVSADFYGLSESFVTSVFTSILVIIWYKDTVSGIKDAW